MGLVTLVCAVPGVSKSMRITDVLNYFDGNVKLLQIDKDVKKL